MVLLPMAMLVMPLLMLTLPQHHLLLLLVLLQCLLCLLLRQAAEHQAVYPAGFLLQVLLHHCMPGGT
jgi:hypothetical protein